MPVETGPAILALNMNNKATALLCATQFLRLFLTHRDPVHGSRFSVGQAEVVREFTFRCRLVSNRPKKKLFKTSTLTSQSLQGCRLGQTRPPDVQTLGGYAAWPRAFSTRRSCRRSNASPISNPVRLTRPFLMRFKVGTLTSTPLRRSSSAISRSFIPDLMICWIRNRGLDMAPTVLHRRKACNTSM